MIKKGKKPKKLVKLVAFIAAIVVTATGTFGNIVLGQTKEHKSSNDFAVMVKDNSLWAVNLLKPYKEVMVDIDGVFKNPNISPDGAVVAYTKNESLYISEIDLRNGQKKAVKIADKITSYDWGNNNDLIYGAEKGGLNGFNLKTKKASIYIKSEERYENIVSDKRGAVYSSVYRYYTKNNDQYVEAKGLIRYDLAVAKERLIIPARPWNDDKGDIGLIPSVAGISKAGDFVYIWCKSGSASLNADGVPFGTYDVQNNKFIPSNKEQVFVLAYKGNLAINPLNGKMPVLNNGGGRNMNINKTIGIVDVIKGTFKAILPDGMISTTEDLYNITAKGMVTMTPFFSPNGKKVIYSASNASNDLQKWLKEPHNIYTVDINTKKVEKITKDNNFDFAPVYISEGKGVVFARKTSEDIVSLFTVKEKEEQCIAKDIKLNEDSVYYGHLKLEESLDIYTN
jgi:hypothetical protein